MTITTLAAHKGNTWKLELDDSGELYFLHVSVVQRCGLQKGMTLTPQQWEQVQTTELARKAYQYACFLLDTFADSLEGLRNERGGVFRAGTGSAMYYIWHARDLGATIDGRLAEEPLPANYAPGINTRLSGPVSLIESFTKPNLSRVINGGPLTIEFHDSVFREDEAKPSMARELILQNAPKQKDGCFLVPKTVE